MSKIDDKVLIEKLLSNKDRKETFEIIVRQYSEILYWKIRRIVLNHEDANDILQNTFIKSWNNIEAFEGKSQISTWLYRIAINESLDFLRKQKKQFLVGADEGISVSQRLIADEYFEGTEAEALLNEAIAILPEMQKTVFLLKYYDDMKYSDMSKLLDKSEGALKANYHLAVQKISEYLKLKG